jgi:predicted dehydrogenase
MKSDISGSALLDLHLHDTDAIRYFFGRPKQVTSFGLRGFRSDNGIDHVFTNYDFEEDMLVVSEGGWAPAGGTPFEMSFTIVGDKGTARLSESGYQVIHEDGKVETPSPGSPDLPTGWHVEIDYMLNCINSRTKPEEYMTIKELADSLAVIEAEEKSIEQNKSIEVVYN